MAVHQDVPTMAAEANDYGAPKLPGCPGRAGVPLRACGRGDGCRAPRRVPAATVAAGSAPGPAVRAGRGSDLLAADHGAGDARPARPTERRCGRSEERRVGKEWRRRWSRAQYEKEDEPTKGGER